MLARDPRTLAAAAEAGQAFGHHVLAFPSNAGAYVTGQTLAVDGGRSSSAFAAE